MMTHEVTVSFQQNGGVEVLQAIDGIGELVYSGNSPQSRKFAVNVMRTLDKDGYAVKMIGANAFEFLKESIRPVYNPSNYQKFSPKEHWYA